MTERSSLLRKGRPAYRSLRADEDDGEHRRQPVRGNSKGYALLGPLEGDVEVPDYLGPDVDNLRVGFEKFAESRPRQSSIVTIISLCNTMMGTSLLTMPWALKEAGLVCGIVWLLAIAGMMFYTSYRVLRSLDYIDMERSRVEFSDVCRHFLGRWAEVVALLSSLGALTGGMLVYWILMANFLHRTGLFIYIYSMGLSHNITSDMPGDPVCPSVTVPLSNMSHNGSTQVTYGVIERHLVDPGGWQQPLGDADPVPYSWFLNVWSFECTTPLLVMVPMTLLFIPKKTTFFTRMNSLSVLSVAYMLGFTAIKAASWGLNTQLSDESRPHYAPPFQATFPALTGVAAFAYFVQNSICTITRDNNPKKNVRDTGIAYTVVCVTYIFMSVVFYITWPLDKECIGDNMLDNIGSNDVFAFISRCALLLQIALIFPLISHVFRQQVFKFAFDSEYPSHLHKWVLNGIILCVCVLVATFYPHIGTLVGFFGAACGLSYTVVLPCSVYLAAKREREKLGVLDILVHGGLILFGLLNFAAQFLILGKT